METDTPHPPTRDTLYYDVDGVLLNFAGPFAQHWNAGVEEGRFTGSTIVENSDCWYLHGTGPLEEQQAIDAEIEVFHCTHAPLPLMHEDIVSHLTHLSTKYVIELVTAYPHLERRMANLALHGLPFHRITCNVSDKLAHIQAREAAGYPVKAIFEDGPHHLAKLLPHYGGKIWAPKYWKYLTHLQGDQRVRLYEHPREWQAL